MPLRIDPDGRRSVAVEVEVPGTAEEVWREIATGPGISSWFVPTKVEEREGGALTSSFGPGMDSQATVTSWDPPHRFAAESRDDMGPNDPTIATEWIVEARAGGTCIVRVVHSWFTSRDKWDHQFEIATYGWQGFFRILRLRLAHFAGWPCSAFQAMGAAAGSVGESWAALTGTLGIEAPQLGGRITTGAGAPPLGGTVERIGPDQFPELLVRLDPPGPGIAHLFAMPMGRQVILSVRLFLYGEEAASAAAAEEPRWRRWLAERFPMGS